MSEFFNPKEDVIDLELTQYGKYLLSKGKMRPHYYAFYDDDVLYDATFAGVTEPSYETHKRIKELTPRTKTQYVFSGIETEIRKVNKLITSNNAELGSDQVQPTADKAYALPIPIGTSGPNTNKSPNWNLFFGKAEISSSVTYFSSSAGDTQIINIPQVNLNHKATSRVGYDADEAALEAAQNLPNEDQEKLQKIADVQNSFYSRTLQEASETAASDSEGFFYYIEQDFVFADIKEENCANLKENFDIEVFEVRNEVDNNTGKTKEVLRQLKFYPTYGDLNELSDEESIAANFPVLTSDYVEYYFDLNTDSDIEDHILCQIDFKNKKENIFADSELEFECLPAISAPNSYVQNVAEPEDPC